MPSILLVSLLVSAAPQAMTSQVVSIADGDAMTILVDKQQHRIRLHGIDAPERKQAYSQKAKEHLAGLPGGIDNRWSTKQRTLTRLSRSESNQRQRKPSIPALTRPLAARLATGEGVGPVLLLREDVCWSVIRQTIIRSLR